jgi:hypothetical protein
MKFLGVVLGAMMATACGGEPSEVDDTGAGADRAAVAGPATATTAQSSFERLRHCGRLGAGFESAAVRRAIKQGAARLAQLQADTIGDNAGNGLDDADPDDGGWDFTVEPLTVTHTAAASPTNLFGETALGAWAAVEARLAGNRALVTALDAGIAMQSDPDIDSPPDFLFGVVLAELAENPGFAQVARQHYDAKRGASGGAAGLAAVIRDGRHARNEDGLIAYDLGWLTFSAAALDAAFPGAGYAADANLYAATVVNDLISATPDFDIANASESFYVIGLSWSQVATAWVGNRAEFAQVRNRLLDQQTPDGAWGTSAAQPADDLQSTALALQTLALTDQPTPRSLAAERRASRFLIDGQAASGGWPDAHSVELPLIDAEIILGLELSRTAAGDDGVVPESPFVVAAPVARTAVVVHASPLP